MSKRRTHSPEFKARVAMEAISGRKTIQEVAADHAIHPIQVSQWKRQLLDGASELFTRGSKSKDKEEVQAVDDATRLAYVEVLADEQKLTVIGFLSRAIAWFNSQGIEPSGDERQRPRLCLQGVRQGLPHPRTQAHPHQALHGPHKRQSGAVHSDPVQRVGLRHGLPKLRGAQPVAALLSGDL